MDNKPVVKYGLPALGVAFFGMVLLNFTFMFAYLVHTVIDRIFRTLWSQAIPWDPPLKHIVFLVIIGVISWHVFRSRLKEYYKIVYLTVPTAVTFITVWIALYQWPILAHLVGALIYGAAIYYFRRTRKPWLYYFTVTLVAVTLVVMGLLGIDI